MAKTQRDFTQGPIAKSMIAFSLPFLLSNILQALYGAVDMLVVGNFSDPDPVISAQILSFEPGSGSGDHSDAVAKTVKDFISTADNNTYFKLTGTVSGFNSQYCSFDLTDATGKIYVYSVANKDAWSSKIANGGTVTLAGKYDYYATKEQHEVIEAEILSFTPGEAPDAKSATVAEAIAAEKNAVLKVGPALVVASASAGFLMEQDGARIYVYGGSAVVGDNVTVTGTKAEYGEAPQLTNPAVVVNSKGTKVTYPDAKDITSTADSYKSTTREFISVKGKLSVSDRYFNVEITGATTVTGSIVKPVEDIAALDGKDVTIKGYYLYHTSSKDGTTCTSGTSRPWSLMAERGTCRLKSESLPVSPTYPITRETCSTADLGPITVTIS